jgi:hypothetical protein
MVSLGGLLLVITLVLQVASAPRPLRALTWLTAGAIATALLLALLFGPRWAAPQRPDAPPSPRTLRQRIASGLSSTDSVDRERALAAARSHPELHMLEPLFTAFQAESDPDLKIHMAEEGLRLHDQRFLAGLVEHLLALEFPYHRNEAAHVLSRYTDLALPDEVDEASLDRVRTWWRESAEKLRWDETEHRFRSR